MNAGLNKRDIKRWLHDVRVHLDGRYERLATDLTGANEVSKVWTAGWKDKAQYTYACLSDSVEQRSKTRCHYGLYIEPARFERSGSERCDDALVLEAAVRVPLPRGKGHADAVGELEPVLRRCIPTLNGHSIVATYPNLQGKHDDRPRGTPYLIVSDEADAWDEQGIWVELIAKLPEWQRDHAPSDARTAASALAAGWDDFRRMVDVVLGALGISPVDVSLQAVTGFVGELLVSSNVGGAYKWLGGTNPVDFLAHDGSKRSIEVKSTLAGFSALPMFTLNELRYALNAEPDYAVIRVALPVEPVVALQRELAKIVRKKKIQEGVAQLSVDGGGPDWLPYLRASCGIPTSLTTRAIERISELIDTIRESGPRAVIHQHPIDRKNLANALEHSLGQRGCVEVRLAGSGRPFPLAGVDSNS